MAKRHDNIFEKVASFSALYEATMRAARGKRKNRSVAKFLCNLETNVCALERELQRGTYQPGQNRDLVVRQPKMRVVGVAPFRDRVVHQALVGAITPIFEAGFVADSYANRLGFGTHRAVARFESHRARHSSAFVLRADIYRYFPSIDHEVLKVDVRRRIACAPGLWRLPHPEMLRV